MCTKVAMLSEAQEDASETALLGLPEKASVDWWSRILHTDISCHRQQTQFSQVIGGEMNSTAMSSSSFCFHASANTNPSQNLVHSNWVSSNVSSNSGSGSDKFGFTTNLSSDSEMRVSDTLLDHNLSSVSIINLPTNSFLQLSGHVFVDLQHKFLVP